MAQSLEMIGLSDAYSFISAAESRHTCHGGTRDNFGQRRAKLGTQVVTVEQLEIVERERQARKAGRGGDNVGGGSGEQTDGWCNCRDQQQLLSFSCDIARLLRRAVACGLDPVSAMTALPNYYAGTYVVCQFRAAIICVILEHLAAAELTVPSVPPVAGASARLARVQLSRAVRLQLCARIVSRETVTSPAMSSTSPASSASSASTLCKASSSRMSSPSTLAKLSTSFACVGETPRATMRMIRLLHETSTPQHYCKFIDVTMSRCDARNATTIWAICRSMDNLILAARICRDHQCGDWLALCAELINKFAKHSERATNRAINDAKRARAFLGTSASKRLAAPSVDLHSACPLGECIRLLALVPTADRGVKLNREVLAAFIYKNLDPSHTMSSSIVARLMRDEPSDEVVMFVLDWCRKRALAAKKKGRQWSQSCEHVLIDVAFVLREGLLEHSDVLLDIISGADSCIAISDTCADLLKALVDGAEEGGGAGVTSEIRTWVSHCAQQVGILGVVYPARRASACMYGGSGGGERDMSVYGGAGDMSVYGGASAGDMSARGGYGLGMRDAAAMVDGSHDAHDFGFQNQGEAVLSGLGNSVSVEQELYNLQLAMLSGAKNSGMVFM